MSREPMQKSNLTVGAIKKEIAKEKTTQAEILKLFGSPNLITKNRKNNEVWSYDKMPYEAKSDVLCQDLINLSALWER